MSAREPHELTLLLLCNDVLRRVWTVAGAVVVCAVASAVLALARPRTYTSVASFVAEARQPLTMEAVGNATLGSSPTQEPRGGGSPIARMLAVGGSSLRASSVAPSRPMDPAFYYTTLRSPEVLLAVAKSSYSVSTPTGVRTGSAADIYGLPAGLAERRAEDAAKRLARGLTVAYEEGSGVLTLSVRTPHAEFSHAVVTRLLDLLTERNRRMADGRAGAQVAFLERAASEARQSLVVAQRRLARFLESNRSFVPASRLALEFHRLDADVVEQRERHADLALQLERARLDRSRATQLATVVVRPEVPSRPDPRGAIRTAVIGGIGGAALALLFVLTSAQLRRVRAAGSRDLQALEGAWRSARRRGGSARAPLLASGAAPAGSRGDGA